MAIAKNGDPISEITEDEEFYHLPDDKKAQLVLQLIQSGRIPDAQELLTEVYFKGPLDLIPKDPSGVPDFVLAVLPFLFLSGLETNPFKAARERGAPFSLSSSDFESLYDAIVDSEREELILPFFETFVSTKKTDTTRYLESELNDNTTFAKLVRVLLRREEEAGIQPKVKAWVERMLVTEDCEVAKELLRVLINHPDAGLIILTVISREPEDEEVMDLCVRFYRNRFIKCLDEDLSRSSIKDKDTVRAHFK